MAGIDPFSTDSCPRLTRLPGTGITLSSTSTPNRTYRVPRATDPIGAFVPVTECPPAQVSGNFGMIAGRSNRPDRTLTGTMPITAFSSGVAGG
jgi:hypothetical protein